MLMDKFHRRNRLIKQYLTLLENCSDVIDWDAMCPPDRALREVISAQERLLTGLERLLEERKARSCIPVLMDASA